MFEPLPPQFSFPEAEERVLKFWLQHDIFGQSLARRAGAPRFVFYEGPPTANGLPHPGHCLTRAIKDLFPRYQTMCGKLVERKAGWDTHGLPVEVEVCKELGIHTKEEIEAYGVEKFVRKCIESVFRYTREWEQMTRRLGFWVNLEDAYVTFHQSYVESVWWSLKTLFDRGLLYQGHKVVWWWAQGGTALSAGEVGEGYRTVQDPSVYVRFPLTQEPKVERSRADQADSLELVERLLKLEDAFELTIPDEDAERIQSVADAEQYVRTRYPNIWQKALEQGLVSEGGAGTGSADVPSALGGAGVPIPQGGVGVPPAFSCIPAGKRVSLLVWTTTPWTLISNHFAAVGPDVDYALVRDTVADEYFVLAAALVQPTLAKTKHEYEIVATCKGAELVGLRYTPPFDVYAATLAAKTAELKTGGAAPLAWRIVPADFIDLATGTGIVHIAPAYGEVDFNLLQDERKRFVNELHSIPLLNAVAPNGNFNAEAPAAYQGRWVKDCDKDIVRELRERGVLLHQETIEHEYPFCPRAEDDALIQYARKSWFVRTSQFKEEFLKNNDQVTWLPDHIQEGRFGDFLRNNVDWALSRERYWGTPLPIWACEQTGKMEAIGSLAELMAKPGATDGGRWVEAKQADPALPDHLRVHKPYIDSWIYDSPHAAGAKMRRVPEVIDCWWDAGSMPFAQWGFPHVTGSVNRFRERFPADFISEAIDQTRGWFYGLLSISTLLFSQSRDVYEHGAGFMRACAVHSGTDTPAEWWNLRYDEFTQRFGARFPAGVDTDRWDETGVVKGAENADEEDEVLILFAKPFPQPYRTCIVLGHVMGEDALKMSKRKKNYKEPQYIFDTYGADAMRWFFYSAQTPWTSIRFQEANIRDAHREFLVRLYNVFSFFNIYANIDGFVAHPRHGSPWRPTAERSELDRWIVSELMRTVAFVREKLDAFENFPAAGRINDFVDALSNWYVRRSRDRFWKSTKDQDKWDAYHTLYGVLWTLSQLIAPFTPFFAETMYQNLTGPRDASGACSTGGGQADFTSPANSGAGSPRPTAAPISVHLCDYPVADTTLIDEQLVQEMEIVRDIVSLGRAARTAAKLKVRQPLGLCEIVLARREHAAWLEDHRALIAEELNIKRVEFSTEADHYVSYQIKPDFKAIGPKFGKRAPQVGAAVQKLDPLAARRALDSSGALTVRVGDETVQLTSAEVQVQLTAKPGWSAAQGRAGVVIVQTELTPELLEEGLVRELIHHVQAQRKAADLPYEARITLYVQGPASLLGVLEQHVETVRTECLVTRLMPTAPPGGVAAERVKIEGHEVTLGIEPA